MLIQNISQPDAKVIVDLLVRGNQTPSYTVELLFPNDTVTKAEKVS